MSRFSLARLSVDDASLEADWLANETSERYEEVDPIDLDEELAGEVSRSPQHCAWSSDCRMPHANPKPRARARNAIPSGGVDSPPSFCPQHTTV